MLLLLQKHFNDIQHHGKLAEQQYTIILRKQDQTLKCGVLQDTDTEYLHFQFI
jgi:hypothetical protein